MNTIDQNTLITKGMSLSKNFILAHTSTGAHHYLLGKIVPTFTSFLIPGQSTIPTWQIAKNLQLGSNNFLENLLGTFGKDLNIRSFFQNNSSSANTGQSFSFSINGYHTNMYGIMEDVLKLTKKAKEIQVVYGNNSFCNVSFDEKTCQRNNFGDNLATITSIDLINNIVEKGVTSIAGIL